jgi:glycerol uptake facilitator-like aquaporin
MDLPEFQKRPFTLPGLLPWYEEYVMSFVAEMVCSAIFGFIVYAAIIGPFLANSVVGPVTVGLAICFGGIALIYAFCDMTLAHFNPAITLAAIVFGRVEIIRGIIFIIAQLCGFLIAAGAVLGCFPGRAFMLLSAVRPKRAAARVTAGYIICVEALLTGILVFIAFSVAINAFYEPELSAEELVTLGRVRRPDRKITQPLVIGLTLGFLSFLAISSSGGAFNPGIVFAPVLLTWEWINSWAYWTGEFGGGLLGAALQHFFLRRTY